MNDPASHQPQQPHTHRATRESSSPGFHRYDAYASLLRAGTLSKPPTLSAADQLITAAMLGHADDRTGRLLVLMVELDGVQLATAARAIGMTTLRAKEQLASLRRIGELEQRQRAYVESHTPGADHGRQHGGRPAPKSVYRARKPKSKADRGIKS